jgi:hypothetical protein
MTAAASAELDGASLAKAIDPFPACLTRSGALPLRGYNWDGRREGKPCRESIPVSERGLDLDRVNCQVRRGRRSRKKTAAVTRETTTRKKYVSVVLRKYGRTNLVTTTTRRKKKEEEKVREKRLY